MPKFEVPFTVTLSRRVIVEAASAELAAVCVQHTDGDDLALSTPIPVSCE